jgi:AcrR family transcriptional regulator
MTERRKRKSAADRKAEIVSTAIRLAADLGPDRVTTQHLADEVGVTQPAIFRHFATKSDIWLAVGDHIVTELTAIHSHPVEITEIDAHDMLHKFVGHHFVHVTENPAIPAILFSRELQAENGSLHVKFSALLGERRDAIAGLIRHAQAAGQHRADLVAEDGAHLLLAAMQGLSMRWLIEDRGFDLAEEGSRMLGSVIDSFRA